ncbi:unnamed protein product [Amoebophrya sp. A25]|nr:unnamed protein product [Amoebophrya sp. A25]|eukprot:GSA25T00000008001.1
METGSTPGRTGQSGRGQQVGGVRKTGAAGHGQCQICNQFVDENEDRETVEKSTRVILGLLAHYSSTVLNVIKHGAPQHNSKTMKKYGDEDDEDDEEQTMWTPCYITTFVLMLVFLAAAIGGFAYALRLRSQQR